MFHSRIKSHVCCGLCLCTQTSFKSDVGQAEWKDPSHWLWRLLWGKVFPKFYSTPVCKLWFWLQMKFGLVFKVAMTREKFPEKIPFRLTRMLTNAMEVREKGSLVWLLHSSVSLRLYIIVPVYSFVLSNLKTLNNVTLQYACVYFTVYNQLSEIIAV